MCWVDGLVKVPFILNDLLRETNEINVKSLGHIQLILQRNECVIA